ncbi:MAG: hypothetical protein ACRCYB_12740 [Aeromonas veronii]
MYDTARQDRVIQAMKEGINYGGGFISVALLARMFGISHDEALEAAFDAGLIDDATGANILGTWRTF